MPRAVAVGLTEPALQISASPSGYQSHFSHAGERIWPETNCWLSNSKRLVSGLLERFCNLTSWCVLPDYRSRSISLLTALLRQHGYHFAVLEPEVGPPEPD